jgi:hypothetical protein
MAYEIRREFPDNFVGHFNGGFSPWNKFKRMQNTYCVFGANVLYCVCWGMLALRITLPAIFQLRTKELRMKKSFAMAMLENMEETMQSSRTEISALADTDIVSIDEHSCAYSTALLWALSILNDHVRVRDEDSAKEIISCL